MSDVRFKLKLFGAGCALPVGFAVLGVLIGVAWASYHEWKTGIDAGNASAFFMLVGAAFGIIVFVPYAVYLFRNEP
jgi:hypothetical protein